VNPIFVPVVDSLISALIARFESKSKSLIFEGSDRESLDMGLVLHPLSHAA
jgi:hypothetical protein